MTLKKTADKYVLNELETMFNGELKEIEDLVSLGVLTHADEKVITIDEKLRSRKKLEDIL